MWRIRSAIASVVLMAVAVCGVAFSAPASAFAVKIEDGSAARLRELLAQRNAMADDAQLRTQVTGLFVGTPYVANTLVGSDSVPEQLVVNVTGVDCFTYVDYVEALVRSHTNSEFLEQLARVRYQQGEVSFTHRRHFFTDWAYTSPTNAVDVTLAVSGGSASSTEKMLNRKDSGGYYLLGLPVRARKISYIPSGQVTDAIVSNLRDGDYVGAYADDGGLDVTHVGMFVRTSAGPQLRNASSLKRNNKVVDSPLREYPASVPGIVVLRPTGL